ncbi:MAG: carbohydrate binding family 9 domain-containing protein [Bacteroidales bacterium]|nr:carbohydrate binding family 9 domain-containing protein [Bacteroidales bacterium]
MEGEIKFDGMPDEDAWSKVVPLPVTTYQPIPGKEPSEKTEVLLGYTDDYFWIGGKLYDSNPSLIQAYSKKRDDINGNNDYIGILIDCLNDNENGVFFCTSPTGNRYDNTFFNDSRDLVPYNMSWNTYWDVKTTITDQGWFVEMRIPFSSLRFKATDGKITMGFLVNRWIPRKNEMIVFPALDPKLGTWAKRRPSLAYDIVFQDIKPRKPVYLTPYILAGQRITNSKNTDGTSFQRSAEYTKEAGIDLKYGITSGLTLDLTANTDFAQVEDDDQQVNITRFSLSYPEKRVFFQERSDLFNFSYGYNGNNGNLFYSRRIGLYDGSPVRILGGARLTGKIGKFDMGFIDMQTAKYYNELPSENFSVLRFKRNILNPYSYAGGIFTSRIRADGKYNYTYGFDTYTNTFGDNYIELKFSQTHNKEEDYKNFLDNTYLRLNLQSSNKNKGWSYRASFDWLGKDYNPAVGFVQRGNNYVLDGNIRYGWMPGESSFLYFHKVNYKCASYYNTTGLLETLITGPGYEFEAKNKLVGSIDPEFHREIIRDTFNIDNKTFIPEDDFSFFVVKGTLKTPASKRLSFESEYEIGQYYDGSVISVKVKPIWAISQSIKLEGQYLFTSIQLPTRDQEYINHITGLKLTYMFSTKLSAGSYIQHNSAKDAFYANIRIRYNPREGNDFYIVFNEGHYTDVLAESPLSQRIESQTLQIKYSHTFTL